MVSTLADDGDQQVTESVAETDSGADGDAPTPAASEPTLDVIFDVLRNSRRRHVIERLAAIEDATTLSDLAEHIAGIENDKPPSSLSSQERKRVYVGLYQSHLPKMTDAGAIRYDDRGNVEPGPHFEVFREYMDGSTATRRPSRGYTVGIVAASLLGVLVTLVASELVSALVIAVLIGVVGIVGIRGSE